ncbi:MAG: RadC family protein [Bacteroidota bacterium]|jgi:DNA repair protein RadC|nr:DNA repair protein RadC [Sphingobacteriales bacterium]
MSEESKLFGIKQWAEDDRPREKLLMKGKASLSDAELLAILIATGTRELTALDLGQQVLKLSNNNLNELGKLGIKDLQKIRGVGKAKAITIAAALELGRRRKETEPLHRDAFTSSRVAYQYFEPMLADLKHEEFWVMLLNRSNKFIGAKRISEGGVSGTVADPKIIMRYAIDELASCIILCHNHPSGSVKPSEADVRLTDKIKQAAILLDIHLIDHIIIGEKTYYSFADEGRL